MKKRFIQFNIVLLFLTNIVFANPNWIRVNYTESTTFTGIVSINGNAVNEGDYIGIFAKDSNDIALECRMMAKVFMFEGKSVVSAVIHGVRKENVIIKYWDSNTGVTHTFDTTFATVPGGDLRNVPLNIKTTTEIINLKEKKENELKVYTFNNKLKGTSSKQIASVTVFNTLGQGVKQKYFFDEPNSFEFDVNDLIESLYLVTVEFTDNTVKTERYYKK